MNLHKTLISSAAAGAVSIFPTVPAYNGIGPKGIRIHSITATWRLPASATVRSNIMVQFVDDIGTNTMWEAYQTTASSTTLKTLDYMHKEWPNGMDFIGPTSGTLTAAGGTDTVTSFVGGFEVRLTTGNNSTLAAEYCSVHICWEII